VAVFGAAGVLGSAVVARLVKASWTVEAFDASEPSEDRRVPTVAYKTVDALDEQSVLETVSGVARPLWGVVNVIGGYSPGQGLADLDLEVLRRQLDLNLISAAVITKHALRILMAQGGGGRLVHTSSRAAVQDGSGAFAYSVSKLGVLRLVEAAAAELKGSEVTVNCIMPSVIDTPANRVAMPNANHGAWPKPDQVAGVVEFLLSDAASLISGAAIPVYGRV